MKIIKAISGLSELALGVLLLVTPAIIVAEEAPSSGFIAASIESKMEDVKISDERQAKRWISADLTSANYNAIMVDRVIYYPAPNPGPQVSSSALEKIADYLTDALRRELGKDIKVVDQAAPGVLRLQPAITAVVIKEEGLSVKDVVPVHLLFSAASAATGKMDEDVTARVEVRITDSMSRDYRAAVQTGIEGEQLKNKDDQVTPQDFQKALDEGAQAGAAAIREALSS